MPSMPTYYETFFSRVLLPEREGGFPIVNAEFHTGPDTMWGYPDTVYPVETLLLSGLVFAHKMMQTNHDAPPTEDWDSTPVTSGEAAISLVGILQLLARDYPDSPAIGYLVECCRLALLQADRATANKVGTMVLEHLTLNKPEGEPLRRAFESWWSDERLAAFLREASVKPW